MVFKLLFITQSGFILIYIAIVDFFWVFHLLHLDCKFFIQIKTRHFFLKGEKKMSMFYGREKALSELLFS